MSRSCWSPVTVVLGVIAPVAAACLHAPPTPAPIREGLLAGLILRADTGGGVDDAVVEVQRPGQAALRESTSAAGSYTITGLAPGRYRVKIHRAEETLADQEVTIVAGRVTGLDLAVGAGPTQAASAEIDVVSAPLWSYRPVDADPGSGTVLGTITEVGARTRLGGAVVSIADASGRLIADAVSDDSGRYRCDQVPPGTYVVSAYYTLLGRGQFEIRRSAVTITGGDVVVVPLSIETGS